MFDTTVLEKITSVAVVLTLPVFGLLPGLFAFTLFLIAADGPQGWALAVGGGLCGLGAGLLFMVGLALLLKRSRVGRARSFLEAVAAQNGAEVTTGSLLLPLLSPRIRGEVHGFSYRLTFRRRGGILSAADIGKRFLIWGWDYDLFLDLRWEGRAAFLKQGAPAALLSLFGISGPPVERDGLACYACGNTGGEALTSDPEALVHAAIATDFGVNGAMVRVQSDGLRMVHSVPDGASPTDVLALLDACAGLAKRARELTRA